MRLLEWILVCVSWRLYWAISVDEDNSTANPVASLNFSDGYETLPPVTVPLENGTMDHNEYVRRVTYLLDNILTGYDKKIRPNAPRNEPVTVEIDLMVRSLGPISETELSYAFDCYFRQTWTDERLRFKSRTGTLSLSIQMLDKIWKPDTYFWNEQHSYLHVLTSPNKFVRLRQDGQILFSSRLTVKAKCPMYLYRFPLDTQECPLTIGSYAYEGHQIKYEWKKSANSSPIHVPVGIKMAQFQLGKVRHLEADHDSYFGSYSVLKVFFIFQRQSGYFLINFYGPCTLIVVLSFVSFWINREATADRIGLGVTSILTMTFLFMDSRSDLPKVQYPTALDIYLFICYAFVVATILQFSVVHLFTKYGTGDPDLRFLELQRINERKMSMRQMRSPPSLVSSRLSSPPSRASPTQRKSLIAFPGPQGPYPGTFHVGSDPFLQNRKQVKRYRLEFRHSTPIQRKRTVSGFYSHSSNATTESKLSRNLSRIYRVWSQRGKKDESTNPYANSVSKIDRVSRILFPLAFGLTSVLYWRSYLANYGRPSVSLYDGMKV